MFNIFSEVARISYGDMCFFRRNFLTILVSSLMGPLMYLVAFGYGMRSGSVEGGVDYISYVIPGLIAMTSMTAGFTTSAQKIIIQRLFHSSFDEMILSPMHIISIVFGKAVIGVAKGLLGCVVLIAIGLFIAPEFMATPGMIGSMLLCCLMFSLMGVTAGLLSKSSVMLTSINSVIILPMTFLCGTLFSVSSLPSVVAAVVWALPLTHASELMRSTSLGWEFPWISLAVVLLYFAVFLLLDYHIIKRKLY